MTWRQLEPFRAATCQLCGSYGGRRRESMVYPVSSCARSRHVRETRSSRYVLLGTLALSVLGFLPSVFIAAAASPPLVLHVAKAACLTRGAAIRLPEGAAPAAATSARLRNNSLTSRSTLHGNCHQENHTYVDPEAKRRL